VKFFLVYSISLLVAFQVYDIDNDGFISNGELYMVLKMMVGDNLTAEQLQQVVDKTILEADEDQDGRISYEEFKNMVQNKGMCYHHCSSFPECSLCVCVFVCFVCVCSLSNR
jgi:hypothetical protein